MLSDADDRQRTILGAVRYWEALRLWLKGARQVPRPILQ